jgi:hypothetical protein
MFVIINSCHVSRFGPGLGVLFGYISGRARGGRGLQTSSLASAIVAFYEAFCSFFALAFVVPQVCAFPLFLPCSSLLVCVGGLFGRVARVWGLVRFLDLCTLIFPSLLVGVLVGCRRQSQIPKIDPAPIMTRSQAMLPPPAGRGRYIPLPGLGREGQPSSGRRKIKHLASPGQQLALRGVLPRG